MDQLVIDPDCAIEQSRIVRFPRPAAAASIARCERAGAVFQETLASIAASFQAIDVTRAGIRRDTETLGQNLRAFNLALEALERSRDKMNQACAEAIGEAERMQRVRGWIERSARAMESGDIEEMRRLIAEKAA